ncbi:hypothetical protein SLEP1_g37515 [Rubroshorea leprosula]|uniref:Uncharacterized protein n=1 Tax=Rubroshorea leprosula TaxID=152421 RepID=A0AAV5KV13_9ROSI|nr:hypothetical protein SLEP1_g37515 [Rubroshorea leprosula]
MIWMHSARVRISSPFPYSAKHTIQTFAARLFLRSNRNLWSGWLCTLAFTTIVALDHDEASNLAPPWYILAIMGLQMLALQLLHFVLKFICLN